mmetsp:Transcript_37678/g.97208  ORF Transcript_37678/g.97208 Transcript_37678/m.97208 type:complete len:220 (-) Transcript_37678:3-662(-)
MIPTLLPPPNSPQILARPLALRERSTSVDRASSSFHITLAPAATIAGTEKREADERSRRAIATVSAFSSVEIGRPGLCRKRTADTNERSARAPMLSPVVRLSAMDSATSSAYFNSSAVYIGAMTASFDADVVCCCCVCLPSSAACALRQCNNSGGALPSKSSSSSFFSSGRSGIWKMDAARTPVGRAKLPYPFCKIDELCRKKRKGMPLVTIMAERNNE